MILAYDGTYYMEHAITEITHTLMETIGIVALVVFLFMGSFRSVRSHDRHAHLARGACLAMSLMGSP